MPFHQRGVAVAVTLLLWLAPPFATAAFRPIHFGWSTGRGGQHLFLGPVHRPRCVEEKNQCDRRDVAPSYVAIPPPCSTSALRAVGGGGGGLTPPNPRNGASDDDDDDDLNKFLDPAYRESENLQRAREYLSENSLPLTADMVLDQQGTDDGDDEEEDVTSSTTEALPPASIPPTTAAAAALVETTAANANSLELTKEGLERNPYMAVISRLSPSELISRFTSSAHPRVQNAVRQTILGMLGGLPKLAFETTTFTTAQRLASLMFQLQMTGYMFKNAEYRLSLQQSLGDYSNSQYLLAGDEDAVDLVDPLKTKVRGKLRIPLADPTPTTTEANNTNDTDSATTTTTTTAPPPPAIEVDAAAYMGELRQEVAQLRKELDTTRHAKEEALRKDLLLYIRTLPEQELRGLTNTMSSDVLVAMKGLVNAVLAGIGEEAQEPITPQTITEQSGEAMAQLCMWQLAIGYNLRTLEVREEMKKSLSEGKDSPSASSDDGISTIETGSGAFE